MRLTVLFKDPFWVGVVEIEQDQRLYAVTHLFGSEPSDQQVYEFISHDLLALQSRVTVGVSVVSTPERRVNPKRKLREVRKQTTQHGISSKAQEAMRLQTEQGKQARRENNQEQQEALRQHKRAVGRARAQAKHRGH